MKKFSVEVNHLWKGYDLGVSNNSYNLLRDNISDFFPNLLNNRLFKAKKNKIFWALKNVSFKVEEGEAIGIIGPNGAGKSSLLKILSQISYPTKGFVKLAGKTASLLEVGTGFSPELTGRENIFLNGAILGMSKKDITSRINEIIEFADIGQFIDVPVKRYSSGMYIRLAFSVAAHLDPEILLIDEVLAVGDAKFQKRSLGKMNDVTKKKGRTVIFVSHDLEAVRRLCTKTLLINKGTMIDYGPTDKIIEKYLSKVNKEIPLIGSELNTSERTGTGEIIIKKVEILAYNGAKKKEVVSGDSFKLRMYYDLKKGKRVDKILVGFLFKSELGSPIFVQHNILTGNHFGEISKPGYFEFHVEDFCLAPGNYNVNCSILHNNGLGGVYYDNINDAFSLHVKHSDYFGTGIIPPQEHGPLLLKGKWTMKQI